jgi:predicted transcriptional regulator
MQYVPRKDSMDEQIILLAKEQPGIRLAELSRKLNREPPGVRNRLLSLVINGDIRLEKTRDALRVFPIMEGAPACQ